MALVFPVVHDFASVENVAGVGELWAWGINANSQLGDGTATNRLSPVQIGSSNDWKMIDGGNAFSIGIKNDGTLWAWGDNFYGQLGDGTTTPQTSPVQIGSATDWEQIACGFRHSIAIRNGGELWAWGRNNNNQLGDGTTTQRNSPVQIGSNTNWEQISAGIESSFGIKNGGELWSWGRNVYGNTGLGTAAGNTTTPTRVGAASDWTQIEGSGTVTAGLKNGGELWTWGYNLYGATGRGTTSGSTLSPTRVGSASDWDKIHLGLGANHGLAIRNGGELWAWGYNFYGSLGDGTTTNRSNPVQIGSGTDWQVLDGGDSFSLALRNGGELWAWGINLGGQLGDGTTTNRNAPVQIGSASDWEKLGAGNGHSLAIKA